MRMAAWASSAALMIGLKIWESQEVTNLQFVLASLLLALSVGQYLRWADKRNTKAPVLPIICAFHFIFFGASVFTASQSSPSILNNHENFPEPIITGAMLIGLIGLTSIILGREIAVQTGLGRQIKLSLLDLSKDTPIRIHLLLILGTAINLFGLPFFGEDFWHVIMVFAGTVPMAAFIWVLLARDTRGIGQLDAILAGLFFVSKIIAGAGFGASLGGVVEPIMAVVLSAISINRAVPWRPIVIVGALVLFLQPSKGIIRAEMASGNVFRQFAQHSDFLDRSGAFFLAGRPGRTKFRR